MHKYRTNYQLDNDDGYQTIKDWAIAGVHTLLIVGALLALALAYFDCLFY